MFSFLEAVPWSVSIGVCVCVCMYGCSISFIVLSSMGSNYTHGSGLGAFVTCHIIAVFGCQHILPCSFREHSATSYRCAIVLLHQSSPAGWTVILARCYTDLLLYLCV